MVIMTEWKKADETNRTLLRKLKKYFRLKEKPRSSRKNSTLPMLTSPLLFLHLILQKSR
jgi:hypothetical protein